MFCVFCFVLFCFFLPELWVLLFCLLWLLLKVIPQVFFVESFLRLQKEKNISVTLLLVRLLLANSLQQCIKNKVTMERKVTILWVAIQMQLDFIVILTDFHFKFRFHLLSGSNESVFNWEVFNYITHYNTYHN